MHIVLSLFVILSTIFIRNNYFQRLKLAYIYYFNRNIITYSTGILKISLENKTYQIPHTNDPDFQQRTITGIYSDGREEEISWPHGCLFRFYPNRLGYEKIRIFSFDSVPQQRMYESNELVDRGDV
jgi:hypothetical protein